MRLKMKYFLLLTLVLLLILTTFVGCVKPKVGDVYKNTNGTGTITLLLSSTFRANGAELNLIGSTGKLGCYPVYGTGTYRYSGSTIYFNLKVTAWGISPTDTLTAKVNGDGSFTACGVTYRKVK